jgi:O-acetylserine/cysteine efflux transporter
MRAQAPPARRPRLGLAVAPWDVALILLVVGVWAYNFIATKIALGEIPPLLLTGLRFALVGAVLLPFVPRPARMAPILALSLVLGVLHFALMFWALAISERIAPLAVTIQLNLPFAALLAALLLGDRLGPRRLLGMALAFAGVTWMGFDPGVFAQRDALALAVGAAFLWALGSVMAKRFEVSNVFTLNAYMALFATPQLLILSLLFEADHLAVLAGASLPAWGGVAYNGLAVVVFGYGVWFTMLRRYSVNLVTPFTLLVPPVAALLSVWHFGERLSAEVILGGLLTLVGVAVVLIRRPGLGPERV